MQNDSNLRLNKFYLITFFILFFFKAQSQEINWISLEEVVEFQKTEPKNVIIDVYTNWCGPCKNIAPFYLELNEKYEASFIKVDIDAASELSESLDIQCLPT